MNYWRYLNLVDVNGKKHDSSNCAVCNLNCEVKNYSGDGCGGTCGTCYSGTTCSNGKCVVSDCTPWTCLQLHKECGQVGDGCGNIINCGNCGSGKSCLNGNCVV